MAAELALPHRRRRDPFDDPGLDPKLLDEAMAQSQDPAHDPDPDPDPPGGGAASGMNSDYSAPRGNSSSQTRTSAAPSGVFRTRTLVVPGVGEGAPGRRSRARNRTGTSVSSTSEPDEGHGVHLFATLLAAARRQQLPGRPRPGPDDVRRAIREGREGNLVIFVVDASGSMAARDRMAAVGGATLSLLRDAYQRRDKVAVITFRQRTPRCCCHRRRRCTPGAGCAVRHGGKTPLAQGLLTARDVVVRERHAIERGAAWWWCSPTAPPADPIRWDGRGLPQPDWLPRARPRSWSTVKHPSCDWVWPNSWLFTLVRRQFGWPSCGPTT